jgi:hypothetical protein
MLPDHGELAASEQAQIDAARARRGWRPISRALTSQFEKRTQRRRLGETTAQQPRSIVGPELILPSHNASDEWQQQAYIFAIPTVEKLDQADILAQRSATARPDHYPGPREAERALVKSQEAERALAKAKARLPLKAREVKRAEAKALAAGNGLVKLREAQMPQPQPRSIVELSTSMDQASHGGTQQ